MKTIRRDMLRKLVEAGQVQVVETYHYDDMSGSERTEKVMECGIMPEDRNQRKEGICYLFPSDFKTGSGACWQNEDGTIHLHVHGNSSYTFRLKPGVSITPVSRNQRGLRPENVRMQQFLAANGIQATVKYIPDGSLRGCWRVSDITAPWTEELAAKLNALGFTNAHCEPLEKYAGNGGVFSVFVRGHNELLSEPVGV